MSEGHLSVLRTLASQASVFVDAVAVMGPILPIYGTSYSSIESVFLSFLEQAGRYLSSKYTQDLTVVDTVMIYMSHSMALYLWTFV